MSTENDVQAADTIDDLGPYRAHAAKPSRRSQVERSADMRQRLINATLSALHDHGFQAVTISMITDIAEVSRGAPLHHFSGKSALVEAAATEFVTRLVSQVDSIWCESQDSEDSLATFCRVIWSQVFTDREGVILSELIQASHRDRGLALILRRLWTNIYRRLFAETAEGARFGAADNRRKLLMTQWLLRGMAADRHLGAPNRMFISYIDEWVALMKGL